MPRRRRNTSGSSARRACAVLIGALLGACGDADEVGQAPPTVAPRAIPPGAWSPVRGGVLEDEIERMRAEGLDWKQVTEEIKRLETIGYLAGTQAAPDEEGVTLHRAERAWAGLNLYVSGHDTEAVLMDMAGTRLHSWSCPFERAFPDAPPLPPGEVEPFRDYFRRCWLGRDGTLLAIFEGHSLIALDRDSKLLWSFAGGAHHDIDVQPDGRIFVLSRTAHLLPRIHPSLPVLEDFVSELDADGRELRRVSVLEAFERSAHSALLERGPESGDLLHTNSVQVLDGRAAERVPAFAAGNVLISCRDIDTLAVIDLERGEVVWAATGTWKGQHEPTLLENGNVLFFDNHGDEGRGKSRVLELDPATLEIVWSYAGTADEELDSGTCSTAQRLPNGNTLITESENGRALEVEPDGTPVWEFVSPHHPPANRELIALLFDLIRLPPDHAQAWLE
jgi:hypothetical protein